MDKELWKKIEAKKESGPWTWAEVSAQLQIDPKNLVNYKTGQEPSPKTMRRINAWLAGDSATSQQPPAPSPQAIARLCAMAAAAGADPTSFICGLMDSYETGSSRKPNAAQTLLGPSKTTRTMQQKHVSRDGTSG